MYEQKLASQFLLARESEEDIAGDGKFSNQLTKYIINIQSG